MDKAFRFWIVVALAGLMLAGKCTGSASNETFTILSGSENEDIADLVDSFAKSQNVQLQMKYDGSVNIMRRLQATGPKDFDAVWPASSLWINLGDTSKSVQSASSVFVSPIVLALKPSVKQRLNWPQEISVTQLMAAIEAKQIAFAMTSATQSNSGAAAYLAFVQALSQKKDPFTQDDLSQPQLQAELRTLLSAVNRSSGSSGWLKKLAIEQDLDAMINYESLVIEANRELSSKGREPYQVVYLKDATGVADSPLGLINQDPKKKAFFAALQQHLASIEGQKELLRRGRRTPLSTFTEQYPTDVFQTAWGIAPKRIFAAQVLPSSDVIMKAFSLYQEQLRKPSLTAYCLDFSGSMKGDPLARLKDAMKLILSPASRDYMIQPSERDVAVVFRFDSTPRFLGEVRGLNSTAMIQSIDNEQASGGTDVYHCLKLALSKIQELDQKEHLLKTYQPAIVVMTDGKSTGAENFRYADFSQPGIALPVFSIMFGEADAAQVESLAKQSSGRVFDGSQDLNQAFIAVKGYN